MEGARRASTTRTSRSPASWASSAPTGRPRVRDASLALYRRGAEVCERAGILLADTKFEFGVLPDGEVILIDEVMTPDSSRFWEAAA